MVTGWDIVFFSETGRTSVKRRGLVLMRRGIKIIEMYSIYSKITYTYIFTYFHYTVKCVCIYICLFVVHLQVFL